MDLGSLGRGRGEAGQSEAGDGWGRDAEGEGCFWGRGAGAGLGGAEAGEGCGVVLGLRGVAGGGAVLLWPAQLVEIVLKASSPAVLPAGRQGLDF